MYLGAGLIRLVTQRKLLFKGISPRWIEHLNRQPQHPRRIYM